MGGRPLEAWTLSEWYRDGCDKLFHRKPPKWLIRESAVILVRMQLSALERALGPWARPESVVDACRALVLHKTNDHVVRLGVGEPAPGHPAGTALVREADGYRLAGTRRRQRRFAPSERGLAGGS